MAGKCALIANWVYSGPIGTPGRFSTMKPPVSLTTLYWLVKRIINEVALHTNKVSIYTENACTKPCLTGWLTSAADAAWGAVPCPASLEYIPRFTPQEIAIPNIPEKAGSNPKAERIIRPNTA